MNKEKNFYELDMARHKIPWYIKLALLFRREHLDVDAMSGSLFICGMKTLFGKVYITRWYIRPN